MRDRDLNSVSDFERELKKALGLGDPFARADRFGDLLEWANSGKPASLEADPQFPGLVASLQHSLKEAYDDVIKIAGKYHKLEIEKLDKRIRELNSRSGDGQEQAQADQ